MSEEQDWDEYEDGDSVWFVEDWLGGKIIEKTVACDTDSSECVVCFYEDGLQQFSKLQVCRKDNFRKAMEIMEGIEGMYGLEIGRRKIMRAKFEKENSSNVNQPK